MPQADSLPWCGMSQADGPDGMDGSVWVRRVCVCVCVCGGGNGLLGRVLKQSNG